MTDKTNKAMWLPVILVASVFAVSSCKKQDTPTEKAEEAVKDAMDTREHEEIKDVVEDMEDAAVDMKNDAKEAVGDALNTRENEKLKDAVEDAEDALEDASE